MFFACKATGGRAVGCLWSVFLLDTAERGEVDGLVVVDEAFVVVVRPTRSGAVLLDVIV